MRTAFPMEHRSKVSHVPFHLSQRLQCRGFGELRKVDVMCYSVVHTVHV